MKTLRHSENGLWADKCEAQIDPMRIGAGEGFVLLV